VKSGAGALTMSAVNTYGGRDHYVDGGTLLVTGTIPGPVTVNSGGTLGGTGTITGAATINAGGSMAPGLSPGQINTGNLALAGAAQFEILGATLGTQYDNINVTGSVTLTGSTLQLIGAYVPAAGDTFTIITNDAADPVVGTFRRPVRRARQYRFNGVVLARDLRGGTATTWCSRRWRRGGRRLRPSRPCRPARLPCSPLFCS
jgi:autotransporter-associated beta strand protein